MRSVSLKVLRAKLREYVRLAAGGETVVITERGRVLAELRRPEDAPSRRLPNAGPPPKTKPVATLADLLAELDSDRADRFQGSAGEDIEDLESFDERAKERSLPFESAVEGIERRGRL
jgi:antitoxin (DNA-binding transcriptional repressor) of toxin-antitoxin stability system